MTVGTVYEHNNKIHCQKRGREFHISQAAFLENIFEVAQLELFYRSRNPT